MSQFPPRSTGSETGMSFAHLPVYRISMPNSEHGELLETWTLSSLLAVDNLLFPIPIVLGEWHVKIIKDLDINKYLLKVFAEYFT